jgi:serine/arginine repetitive matrix protein 2
LESRQRTPLSSIFPLQQVTDLPNRHSYLIVTIEEATSDGHGAPEDELLQEESQEEQPVATPMKKARVCPLSEQLLGRNRPCPMHEDDEG